MAIHVHVVVAFLFTLLIPTFTQLDPGFYLSTCPNVEDIVREVLKIEIAKDGRLVASIPRLFFHDCFVQGCDASVLLDGGEREAKPNKDSARGFKTIENIKEAVEKVCPETVSCADILALATRDSIVIAGGPTWKVPLGRKDSLRANQKEATENIAGPNNNFSIIWTKFQHQGLNLVDLTALSGAHTLGMASCRTFRDRLYNFSGTGKPDRSLDFEYAEELRHNCSDGKGDLTVFPLDPKTPLKFDNSYYQNLMASKGLLNSDNLLVKNNDELVKKFASDEAAFFTQFTQSMVKMGNILPLTGSDGEIRRVCHKVNDPK